MRFRSGKRYEKLQRRRIMRMQRALEPLALSALSAAIAMAKLCRAVAGSIRPINPKKIRISATESARPAGVGIEP